MQVVLESDEVLAAAYPTLALDEARCLHERAALIKLEGKLWPAWLKAIGPEKHRLAKELGGIDARLARLRVQLGLPAYRMPLQMGMEYQEHTSEIAQGALLEAS